MLGHKALRLRRLTCNVRECTSRRCPTLHHFTLRNYFISALVTASAEEKDVADSTFDLSTYLALDASSRLAY